MLIFTIYLNFKWINYEAEFSSIFIMKHAYYIYNQDIEMFELVLSKKDLEVIFLHKKLEKDIFNKNNKLKVKI